MKGHVMAQVSYEQNHWDNLDEAIGLIDFGDRAMDVNVAPVLTSFGMLHSIPICLLYSNHPART